MSAVTFTDEGTFKAAWAAEQWLRDRGFSVGPSSVDGPQAIWFGDCVISKWRGLTTAEKCACHATLDGNQRSGPMTITLRGVAPPEARAAFALTDEQVKQMKEPK